MSHTTPPHFQQGFTLLEVMITVSIASILLAIAVPSFQSTMARAQLTTQTNNFVAAIASARNEAIKNNARTVLCASSGGTSCNGAAWTQGWIVFIDTDQDNVVDVGEVITTVGQATNDLVMLGNANIANRIRFGPDGLLAVVNNGTIRVCKATNALPANENARDIVINRTGRPRVQAPSPAIALGTCPAP